MSIRLVFLVVASFAGSSVGASAAAGRPPNFVILFADDLGYGDLGCYGHPTIRTPNLDRMAAEGMRFTQFYSAAPVCTPSRAALLTGRLPIRNGMCGSTRRVLFPNSTGGLQDAEITIAEALKTGGYATACVGKWHLGHLPAYLPTRHGFDSYFGIPYSNDMKPTPLIRDETVIEEPAEQKTLTLRYTQEAIAFITKHRDHPFFLYLAYTFPHVPLHASDRFAGSSPRGLYGDVVEELDWSVGEILRALREQQLATRTLVVFSSDNGPWLTQGLNGGSAGLLRGGKGSAWEGGMREPGIFWWPGTIRSGTVAYQPSSTLDLFPTILELAGVPLPTDRLLDGTSIVPVLRGAGSLDPRPFFYYDDAMLMAVRKGPWKAFVRTRQAYGPERRNLEQHNPPLLYHLERDPSETHNVAKEHPDVVADLLAEIERHERELKAPPSQVDLEATSKPPSSKPAA